jgi:hypothetical protein
MDLGRIGWRDVAWIGLVKDGISGGVLGMQ